MKRLVVVILSIFILPFIANISLASPPETISIPADQFQVPEGGVIKVENNCVVKTLSNVAKLASIVDNLGHNVGPAITDGNRTGTYIVVGGGSGAPHYTLYITLPQPIVISKLVSWGRGTNYHGYYRITGVKGRNSDYEEWTTLYSGNEICSSTDNEYWDSCEIELSGGAYKELQVEIYHVVDGIQAFKSLMGEIELYSPDEINPKDATATTSIDLSSYDTVNSISFNATEHVKYLFNLDFGGGSKWYYYNGSSWEETTLEEIDQVGMNDSTIRTYSSDILEGINSILQEEGTHILQIAAYLPNITQQFRGININATPFGFAPEDVTFEKRYKYNREPGEVEIEVKDIRIPSRPSCNIQAINVDYGDGNTEQLDPGKKFTIAHTYPAGSYTAKLTIDLGCGDLSTTVDIPIVILSRANAAFDISKKIADKAEHAPITYRFTANVSSQDERNQQLGNEGIIWTIKKDENTVAVLQDNPESGQPSVVEYTFEEGGEYSIFVEAKSSINTDITGSLELPVPERAEATFNIKARMENAYAPTPCNFSAVLASSDTRNRNVANGSDISWTITKDGNVIASLTGKKPEMKYTFEEGGTYNILVEADTPIGTHATGSSTIEVLPRAEVNLNAEIKKRFFPGKVTIRPSLSSDDKRNRKISYCTVQVFDPDGEEIYNEKKERVLAPVIIDLNEKPGNYIAKVSVVTSIGTEITKDFPFEFLRAPASAGVTVKTRHSYVPAELQIRRKITSVDSRNRFAPVEEKYEIWYHDEQNPTLIDTIPLSPENRGRITYTISSPGAYTVKYLATSQIGTQITGESSVFEIQDAAPIIVTIKPSCKPGVEGPVPIDCRFKAWVKSSDPRNKRITVSHWEVYKGGSDTPIVTLHKEGKEALRSKQFACRFTEPGTYVVKYIPTVETNFSAEGIAEVVALEPAAVDAEIVPKCKPPYAPSKCSFKASIIAADKRDKLSSCQWKVYKGDVLLYETEPGRSTRLRYSFEEGGQYTIVFNAETRLGKTIEKQQVVEIGDRMPVALQIIPKLPRFNRPPAAYRFSIKSVSEDKRQKSIRDISVKILNPQGEEIYSGNRPVFSYTFTEPGCYTVKAQAVTSRLGTFVTGELPVTVDPNQLPEISKVVATQNRIRPMQYKFSVQAIDKDGKVRSYHWDFGDGSTADRKSVNHEYASPGTYTVTVETCDNSGECSNCQTQVHVGS